MSTKRRLFLTIVDDSYQSRLKDIVDEIGIRAVQNYTGMKKPTIYKWISGENRPPLLPIVKLCHAIGKPVEWLMSGDDIPNESDASSFSLIPRINIKASLGPGYDVDEEQVVGHYAFSKNWLSYKNIDPKSSLLIKAVGESMNPTIQNNDTCLVDLKSNHPKDGKIYAISLLGSAKIKRVVFKMDGSIILRSDNPDFEDEVITHEELESLKIVGRVVWFGRDAS